jgi:putative spermidine/putrescine transport system ATP-binding protein
VASATPAAIELIDIGLSYPDGTRALDRISLSVPDGSVMALLGPSGSGKSTALKVVGGLLPATDGRVRVGGVDVTDVPSERRNVGIVFQSYALFPNMSVQDNVGFGLRVRGVARAQRAERVAAMLSAMKIAHLRDKRIRQISGGEAQRVALARAMVFNPSILLMDEPLSALDAQIRDDLRAELRRFLREFRTTTIYVTHDQTEALALGDRVAVMRQGRIVQTGTPAEIYTRPSCLFVASFIGNANLIPCSSAGGHRLTLPFAVVDVEAAREPGDYVFMFRPEDAAVAGDGRRRDFTIKVDEVVYLGSRARIVGHTETGHRILLDARDAGRVRVGDPLPIAVDRQNCHVLDKEAAS